MRRIHWLLAGLALAIGAGAVAQVVPGGLPSNPTFSTVKTRTGIMVGNVANPGWDQGTNSGYIGGLSSGILLYKGGADIEILQNAYYNGTGYVYSTSATAGRVMCVASGCEMDHAVLGTAGGVPSFITDLQVSNAGVVTVNGFRVPKISFGEFIATSGGCSNNSGVWQTQNLGGTCTRNSVGVFTVNFSSAYAGSPICLANVTSASAGSASVNSAGTTSVTVGTVNTTFTPADVGSFFVTCTGF